MHIRRWTKGRLAPLLLGGAAVFALGLAACGGDDDDTGPTAAATTAATPQSSTAGSPAASTQATLAADIGKNDSGQVTGQGATFPQVIYAAWFSDYQAKVAKNVQVNYQGTGSGAGVTALTSNTVDFAASDVGMTDAQLQAAPDAQLLPTVVGEVVLTYNVSGL